MGLPKGQTQQKNFLRRDSQINALINELIEEMGTKDSIQNQEISNLRAEMVELITFMRDKPLNERSDSSVPQIAMLNFSFTTTYASEVQA